MTKKRFAKLCRAYFTRLNEWAKENNSTPMDMGKVYKHISKGGSFTDTTRAEWWAKLSSITNTFGVGVKEAKR